MTQGQLGGRIASIHRRRNIRVLGFAIDQICPMDQVGKLGRLKAEVLARNLRNELGARAVVRIVEFFPAVVVAEMLGIGRRQERALVMVEPPGEAVGGGILEVNDGVFTPVCLLKISCG